MAVHSKSPSLSILAGLAPLALYYGVEAVWTKTAALLTMLFWMASELGFYRWRRWPITPLFLFANFITLGFALEDLWLESSHATAWEPVITNAILAVATAVATTFLPTVLREIFAQAQRPAPDEAAVSYFRFVLAAWALFFLFAMGVGLFLALHPSPPAWAHHCIGYGPTAVWALLCFGTARPLHRALLRRRQP